MFQAKPKDVLKGARQLDPIAVAVVALTSSGKLVVSGSGATTEVLTLLAGGKARIAELAE